MSKFGKLIERVKGYDGTVFIYVNVDGGFTVRYPNEPLITINTLEGAQRLARQIAGPKRLVDSGFEGTR